MSCYVTLLDFYSGIFPFPVDDAFIISHCGARGYDAELTALTSLSANERDLIKADLLKGVALSLCGWQSKTGSTAFSSEQRGDAITSEQRRSLLMEANSIYCRCGEPESAYKLNAINVWEDETEC